MVSKLKNCLSPLELETFESLTTPAKIQTFLDQLPYRVEDDTPCPLVVMQEKRAHCLDGALFAAVALRNIGFAAKLIDLLPEPGTDDDHVLAVYRHQGCYGAVAKSNFFTLRSREPIYRTLRELALSYFEWSFNIDGLKSLREYTLPLNLQVFDHLDWMCSNEHIRVLVHKLEKQPRIRLVTPEMVRDLNRVDELSFKGGMFGVNLDGVYKPK